MCFVKQYMIVCCLGVKYFPTKETLKEYARRLQLLNISYKAYKWVDRRSHYRLIGGWVYEE